MCTSWFRWVEFNFWNVVNWKKKSCSNKILNKKILTILNNFRVFFITSLCAKFSDILSKSNRIVFEHMITLSGANWPASRKWISMASISLETFRCFFLTQFFSRLKFRPQTYWNVLWGFCHFSRKDIFVVTLTMTQMLGIFLFTFCLETRRINSRSFLLKMAEKVCQTLQVTSFDLLFSFLNTYFARTKLITSSYFQPTLVLVLNFR